MSEYFCFWNLVHDDSLRGDVFGRDSPLMDAVAYHIRELPKDSTQDLEDFVADLDRQYGYDYV